MKTKKIIAMLMAATLTISAFSACSSTETSSSESSKESSESSVSSEESSESEEAESSNMDGDLQLNEPGQLPLVIGDEPGVISIFTSSQVDTHSDFDVSVNTATQWYEKQTNTHIDWTIVTKADKQAKLNLLFQSDEYEDVIFMSGWNSATQYSYGSQGYILPLNEYLDGDDAYWWNLHRDKALEVGQLTQDKIDDYIMPDGNIYTMGQTNGAKHVQHSFRMWIYEPWLETLGLEVPTTTEEYYEVLKAFKDQDPNGNGKADEIPLTGAITGGFNIDPTVFLMNSFLYYDKATLNYLDDGKVTMVYTTDAYKDGISYMAKLCAEDLMTMDIYTNTEQIIKGQTTQDVQLVGSVPGSTWSSFTTATTGEDGDWLNYIALAPLEGPNGVRYAKYNEPGLTVKAHITNNCEYPRLAFRMIDYMYEDECGMNLKNGVNGAWVYAEDGQMAINGEQAKWELMIASRQTGETNFAWGQIGVATEPPGWHSYQAVKGDDIALDFEAGLYNAGAMYSEFKPEAGVIVPALIFNEEDSKEVVDYTTQLNAYVSTEVATMITTNSVEENWDAFQAQLKAIGVEELTALYQKAYDERIERLG